MIKLASKVDLAIVANLASVVREDMLNSGLKQWLGNYPAYENFYEDFVKQGLYVYFADKTIVGSISILPENDLAYKEVIWESDNALVVHRILVNPNYQRQGIGKELINFSVQKGLSEGYGAIKIDTHPDNLKMQGMLKTLGFIYRGYLASINRLAYELVLKKDKGE